MYTALIKLHWPPSQWLELTRREKAFVIACLNEYADETKRLLNK